MQFQSSLTLGALFSTIATAVILNACSAPPRSPQSTSETSTTMASMDHGSMGHGSMAKPGAMVHSASDLGPADADYDLRFIDGMIPHHEGALVMANKVLKKSNRPELKALATAILKTQTAEIDQLKQWRSTWYPKASAKPMAWHGAMGHMMPMPPEQISAMRMDMDLGAADTGFDQRFLAAMIPHHQGAIVMAKDLLAKSKRPEMQKLAQAILASQQPEIDQMKSWQTSWQPPSPK
jgi:uncharacterized protein (DUF305 family)